ncbi:MAG: ATP-binding protein, partial [Bacteroidales bacterium]
MEPDFIQQFKSFINCRALVSPSDKILLAVSGGADSVVMTHLFLQLNYSIAIAHVNFQLRGDESDGDEAFVRNLAKQFGIPIYVKTIDTHHFAKVNHLSTQVAAREIRYD